MDAGVILIKPKYGHNVGAAIRNVAAHGYDWMRWTDDRFDIDSMARIPREERYRDYQSVDFKRNDRPFDELDDDVVPVAIELLPASEQLHEFVHPEKAVYVFGPEDGSIPKAIRVKCHRFVVIPTFHCLNLSVAMGVVLSHRRMQMIERGLEPRFSTASMLAEDRG